LRNITTVCAIFATPNHNQIMFLVILHLFQLRLGYARHLHLATRDLCISVCRPRIRTQLRILNLKTRASLANYMHAPEAAVTTITTATKTLLTFLQLHA